MTRSVLAKWRFTTVLHGRLGACWAARHQSERWNRFTFDLRCGDDTTLSFLWTPSDKGPRQIAMAVKHNGRETFMRIQHVGVKSTLGWHWDVA